jgi:hypothetical protein
MINAIPAMLYSRFPAAHPTSRVKIPIATISSDTKREIGLTFTDTFEPPIQSAQLNDC